MKLALRLSLAFGLVMVAVLELPIARDLAVKQGIAGEVRGEVMEAGAESIKHATQDNSFLSASSPPSFSLLPLAFSSPFSPAISPLSSPVISPLPSPAISPSPLSSPPSPPLPSLSLPLETEIILLAHQIKLQDGKLSFKLPNLTESKAWVLEIEYELISQETALGFDQPGFTVSIDEYLTYQQSAVEIGPKTISFNPLTFTNHPTTLTLWSGNTGDELQNTQTTINSIKLTVNNNKNFIEIKPISDLFVTVDKAGYLTLEWTSPQTNDQNLNKALGYEIRFFTDPLTEKNWTQAQLIKRVLPAEFSPQPAREKEFILVQFPAINQGYLTVRAYNSDGSLSPATEVPQCLIQ